MAKRKKSRAHQVSKGERSNVNKKCATRCVVIHQCCKEQLIKENLDEG